MCLIAYFSTRHWCTILETSLLRPCDLVENVYVTFSVRKYRDYIMGSGVISLSIFSCGLKIVFVQFRMERPAWLQCKLWKGREQRRQESSSGPVGSAL